MAMQQEPFDAAAATVGSKLTYFGAGSSTFGWLLHNEFGVIFGIVIGVLGYLTNVYFQRRRDRREEREHHHRMGEPPDDPS